MTKPKAEQLTLFPLTSPREEARERWRQHMREFDRQRQERRRHGLKKRHANKLTHIETKEAR
jgi:hypothetical protein